jgi:hypothetical protein
LLQIFEPASKFLTVSQIMNLNKLLCRTFHSGAPFFHTVYCAAEPAAERWKCVDDISYSANGGRRRNDRPRDSACKIRAYTDDDNPMPPLCNT